MDEREKTSLGSMLVSLQATPIFSIVSIFSIVIGVTSAADGYDVPPALYLFAFAISALVAFASLRRYHRRARARPLPPPSGFFSPFPNQSSWQPWKRQAVTAELCETIELNDTKHILLVSPSGTGKSTLVNYLLPERMTEYQYIVFTEYSNIAETVLLRVGALAGDAKSRNEIHKIIKEISLRIIQTDDFHGRVTEAISTALSKQKLLLCFDQAERYFTDAEAIAKSDYRDYSAQNALIRSIMKGFSSVPTVRTVFAIRSEYVFGSMSSLFNRNSNGTDIDEYVEFFFLWGVNAVDDEDVFFDVNNAIVEKYGNRYIGEKIIKLSRFDSPAIANTFVLGLSGYIFFELYEREDYRLTLDRELLTGDDLIDVYLDASFEGLVATSGRAERPEFDAVLYALACENKLAGQACSLQRLAGLCHYPIKDVKLVVDYLMSTGMINQTNIGGTENYRIYHDKIADRILKSDRLEIHSRGVDGIRFLTENRVSTDFLSTPSHFPSALEISRFFDVSYLPVALFVLFGVIRMLAPDTVFSALAPLYGLVTTLSGFEAPPYFREPIYYVPVFLAHLAWVSYIDRVNRAYIQHVGSRATRLTGNTFAAIGTSLGVCVAFHPQLFVIPIVAVGFIYGILLLIISVGGTLSGEIRGITRDWGVRSAGNVIVVLILGLTSAPLFEQAALILDESIMRRETFHLLAITIAASLLLWFWHHIKGEQNNRKVWSANLALVDKGRVYERRI